MDFRRQIKQIREDMELTQAAFGKLVGVSEGTVQGWELGARKPSLDVFIHVVETLGVTSDELLGISTTKGLRLDEQIVLNRYRELDKYGKTLITDVLDHEATRSRELREKQDEKAQTKIGKKTKVAQLRVYSSPSAAGIAAPISGEDYEMVDWTDNIPHKTDFGVRIQGNSMNPYIKDGDIVYVEATKQVENEEVGIFYVDDAVYCKQCYKDKDGTLYLLSANENFVNSNIVLKPDSGATVITIGRVLLEHTVSLPGYFKKSKK